MEREIARRRAWEGAPGKREVSFYAVSRGVDVYALHPCRTARDELEVEATCFGCRAVRHVALEPFLESVWAHAPWVRIMPSLVCSACGERPEEIAFYSKDFSGLGRHFVAKLTVRRPTDEELEALSPKKRKVWATRTVTPEELIWRRPGLRPRKP